MSFTVETDRINIVWWAVPGNPTYVATVYPDRNKLSVVSQQVTTGTQATLSGLQSCKAYYYEVVAYGVGLVEGSDFVTVRPATGLVITVRSDLSVRFSWRAACGSHCQNQFVDIGTSPGSYDVYSYDVGCGATSHDVPMSLPPGNYYGRVNNKIDGRWYPSTNVPFTISVSRQPASGLVCAGY